MLNPLDTSLFNYYNTDGKNITEFVLDNRTKLSLERPKHRDRNHNARGYSFEVEAVLKHKTFTDIKSTDRRFWIWGDIGSRTVLDSGYEATKARVDKIRATR